MAWEWQDPFRLGVEVEGGRLVKQEWRMFLANIERLSKGLGNIREEDKTEKVLRHLDKDLVMEIFQLLV